MANLVRFLGLRIRGVMSSDLFRFIFLSIVPRQLPWTSFISLLVNTIAASSLVSPHFSSLSAINVAF